MGVSPNIIRTHISHWEAFLKRTNRPHRQHWPSRLFRHEPVENAVKILQSGILKSRNDANREIILDIAPADIINNRNTAHDFVRLYFRPRSPTQYRIEGIRKPEEYFQQRHAPVLVMMVFGSEQILTTPDTEFSDGNMQSALTIKGRTNGEFQALPFAGIYHEGPFDSNSPNGVDITRRRCAEVLLPQPLNLQGTLQSILCRSPAERATLLHLLENEADEWSEKIRVVNLPGLFDNYYVYVDTVDGGPDGIAFTLHPRYDGKVVMFEMWVNNQTGAEVIHSGPLELSPAERWVVRRSLSSGTYIVRIELEDCMAHIGSFIVDEMPF